LPQSVHHPSQHRGLSLPGEPLGLTAT
jgi:hypothetical protein